MFEESGWTLDGRRIDDDGRTTEPACTIISLLK